MKTAKVYTGHSTIRYSVYCKILLMYLVLCVLDESTCSLDFCNTSV